MSFGISNSVKSQQVQICTPEMLREAMDEPLVAQVCAEIKDAWAKSAIFSQSFVKIRNRKIAKGKNWETREMPRCYLGKVGEKIGNFLLDGYGEK